MDKRALSERDICTKFITPALRRAGWGTKCFVRSVLTRVELLSVMSIDSMS